MPLTSTLPRLPYRGIRTPAGLFALLLTLAAPPPAPAGINHWTAVGPGGGTVTDLGVALSSPELVYAATAGGLFASADGGRSWERRSQGLAGLPVVAVAVSPADARRVYTATPEGLFRSTDGAESWERFATQLTAETQTSVQVIRTDPADPSTLYLAARPGGILVSTDGGDTWQNLSAGAFRFATDLVVDPGDPLTLYAANYGGHGVFKSTDGGLTWRAVDDGLTRNRILSLALLPGSPSLLFATAVATLDVHNRTELFLSTDGGESWQLADGGAVPFSAVNDLAFDPGEAQVAYVATTGLFRTRDGGVTWQRLGGGLPERELHALALPGGGSGAVLAGAAHAGVLRSEDGGDRWAAANRGLTASDPVRLEIHPGVRGGLLATIDVEGHFESDDAGARWRPWRTDTAVSLPTFARSAPSHVYGVRNGSGSLYDPIHARFFRSSDGGRHFEDAEVAPWRLPRKIEEMLVDPVDPRVIYILGTTPLPGPWAQASIHRSEDGGHTWTPIGWGGDEIVRLLRQHPRQRSRLYFATVEPATVYHSSDAGATWESSSPCSTDCWIGALALDPADPDTLYAGTQREGAFKSTDGGVSWEPAGLGGEAVVDLAVDPDASATVYAITDGGFRVSRDGALTWQDMGNGLPGQIRLDELEIDPGVPKTLYVTTDHAGIYRYTPAEPATCLPGATTLCLAGDRFEVSVDWIDRRGRTGSGRALPLTADTGAFFFFDDDAVELIVKIINGGGLNGHFWVFYASLSDVSYALRVTDRVTGDVQTYFNPPGTLASHGDDRAFLALGELAAPSAPPGWPAEPPLPPMATCEGDATHLCLAGRFRMAVEWTNFRGVSGTGKARGLTEDTGTFWFFDEDALELAVKVVDGRGLNGRFWIFYAALSNVEYRLKVTDTVTGAERIYSNPAGTFASSADTEAF